MGVKLKAPLKDKESYTGTVSDVTDTHVIFETKDGKKEKIPFPEHVIEEINENHNEIWGGDTIKITRNGDEYDIDEVEEKEE